MPRRGRPPDPRRRAGTPGWPARRRSSSSASRARSPRVSGKRPGPGEQRRDPVEAAAGQHRSSRSGSGAARQLDGRVATCQIHETRSGWNALAASGSMTTIHVTKVGCSASVPDDADLDRIDARRCRRRPRWRDARAAQAEADEEVAAPVHLRVGERERRAATRPAEVVAGHRAVEVGAGGHRAVHRDLDLGVRVRRERAVVEVQRHDLDAAGRDPRGLADEADARCRRGGRAPGVRRRGHDLVPAARRPRLLAARAATAATAPSAPRPSGQTGGLRKAETAQFQRSRPSTHSPTGKRRKPARS